jgi:quercetin dioxygenase-like cupin family protein
MCRRRLALIALPFALASAPLAAQTKDCEPVADRAGRELGCFVVARLELGHLPDKPPLYWHIDSFPNRKAAEAVVGPRGVVVESLGHIWLYTLAESTWKSGGGRHVATIGPLPIIPARAHAAVYMEGVFQPGMKSPVHRHPGVEAWYTLEGSMCLETPEGTMTQSAGGPGVLAYAGTPMELTGTGTGTRRSLVLILQDSSKPRNTHADDWTPKGLCSEAPH